MFYLQVEAIRDLLLLLDEHVLTLQTYMVSLTPFISEAEWIQNFRPNQSCGHGSASSMETKLRALIG